MKKIDTNEFDNLIKEYIEHPAYQELKKYKHHGSTRYDHSYRVALGTYKVTKKMGLDYVSSTKAAILHDFFTEEVSNENSISRLRKHADYAVENSKKYFGLSEKEEDIIRKHMFPVTFTPPKYLESWIVDIVDDAVAIKERSYIAKKMYYSLKYMAVLLIIMILS